jgi:biopolymer transport protein ExbD
MPWQLRHEGSPRAIRDLTLQAIVDGLRDGLWHSTDEVMGPGETQWRHIESHPKLEEIVEELEAPPPRRPEPTSLDMNALIDVCLVLLIFFILTTTYANLVQKVVPIPVDRAEAVKVKALKVEDIKAKMIMVTAADKSGKPEVLVERQRIDVLTPDGKGIDTAKLRSALQPYVRGEDHKTEMLLDARGVTWEAVIQIQDAARDAGIKVIKYAKPVP